MRKQVRPRLTVGEVQYLLHLIELQRESLQNYPENFPYRSEAWNNLLVDVIFKETTDEFTVRVAQEPKEIKDLLEVGFEFVCEKDDLMFFRKRK